MGFGKILAFSKKNAPTIAVATGLVGFGLTIWEVIQAKPKSDALILQALEEKKKTLQAELIMNEDGSITYSEEARLSLMEKIKTTWKVWTPPLLTGLASTACIVFGTAENLKRQAALIAAVDLAEQSKDIYRQEVEKEVGKEKEREIYKKATDEEVKRLVPTDPPIMDTGFGDVIFIDGFSKQIFRSNVDKVKNVLSENNYNLSFVSGEIRYSALQEGWSIEESMYADEFGWVSSERLKNIEWEFVPTSVDINYQKVPAFKIVIYPSPTRCFH